MTVHADAFPDLVVVKADAASESKPEAGLWEIELTSIAEPHP
jgi:hypothetical protein